MKRSTGILLESANRFSGGLNLCAGSVKVRTSVFKKNFVRFLSGVVLALFLVSFLQADGIAEAGPDSELVINNYLAARQAHENSLNGASMEVSIDASVPKLKKKGTLHALRSISKLGKITYKVLGFQGDDSVIKNEVIARYLEAEQKGQDDRKLAITPENYKFKYKGLHTLTNGDQIYIIFLSPRKKLVGLFKGEMWLDSRTYLPVMESGKLVKNPSAFFKKVEFVRDFSIRDGNAIPQHMDSIIDARLIGKVNLSIDYTKVGRPPVTQPAAAPSAFDGTIPPQALAK
jgi:hypothetical protein